ncbi:unnamed protein product [Phyllotreta striolata]|uniref:Uncharacterized protein n=1 Tax=Phyllotreta striolata TaxID=444603 RepID=A0A9N9XLP2_PHYSR|nr:unnamed protein product [Phyllotreta striolata]
MDSCWSKDISQFQKFSFEIAETFFKSKGWTQSDISRGYKFFAGGFVHDVLFDKLGSTLKAKCYRSKKK